MSKLYTELTTSLQDFIERQKIFFVATAPASGRINLSPKGLDSFKILSPNKVVWLNVTGSGNETAAHIQENNRMTIMFNSFSGDPLILRLYGLAQMIHPAHSQWHELYSLFDPLPGARQIFVVTIESAQTSCGMAVPIMENPQPREQLNDWARKKGPDGIKNYWLEKNTVSIDGIVTNIADQIDT